MNPTLINLPTPITTPRLHIRIPKNGDGAIVNQAIHESFAELNLWMPWAYRKPTEAESEEYVRSAAANWIVKRSEEPWLPLLIFDREHNDFIGACGFHDINWEVPCLEIGYWIRYKYSGYGFMTEAINALTRYAIQQIKAKRVEIRCDHSNIRSIKIPGNLGYHLEAQLKQHRLLTDGRTISDTLIYVRHDLEGIPDLDVKW